MKPIKVGLLGLGTVGRGTFSVLKRNQAEIMRRAGRGIQCLHCLLVGLRDGGKICRAGAPFHSAAA